MNSYIDCDEMAFRTSLVIDQYSESMNGKEKAAYLIILKRRIFDKIADINLTDNELNDTRDNIKTFLNQL